MKFFITINNECHFGGFVWSFVWGFAWSLFLIRNIGTLESLNNFLFYSQFMQSLLTKNPVGF